MLKIKLQSHEGYEEEHLSKLNESLSLLESVLNGEPFKKTLINFKSDKTEGGTFHFIMYTKILSRKIHLQRYSNQEIYDRMMKGNEQATPDNFIIYNLVLEKGSGGSTVGQTDENGFIHTYETDFDEMSPGQVAAHLCHEYMHTLDFEHSPEEWNDRLRNCFSVPYAIGNFVEIITTGACRYQCVYQ